MKVDSLKKTFAVLLSVVMALSVFGTVAFAIDGFTLMPKQDGASLEEGDYWFDFSGFAVATGMPANEIANYQNMNFYLSDDGNAIKTASREDPTGFDVHRTDEYAFMYFPYVRAHGYTLLPKADSDALEVGDYYLDLAGLLAFWEAGAEEAALYDDIVFYLNADATSIFVDLGEFCFITEDNDEDGYFDFLRRHESGSDEPTCDHQDYYMTVSAVPTHNGWYIATTDDVDLSTLGISYYCTYCQQYLDTGFDPVDVTGIAITLEKNEDHVFDESIAANVTTVPATCTEDGAKTVKCAICDETQTTKTEDRLGHDFDEALTANVTVVPSVCNQVGTKTVKCSRCDATQVTDLEPAPDNHDFDESIEANVIVVPSVCNQVGTKTVKCSRCDATQVTDLAPAPDNHDFDDTIEANVTVVPSVCNQVGTKTVKCSRCDATQVTDLAPAPDNHDFDDTIEANVTVVAATCTEPGSKTVKCSRCDATKVTEIKALGHDFDDSIAANVTTAAATCTEDGSKTVKCSRCDATDVAPIAANGHQWGEWTVTREATEDAKGEKTRECAVCHETQTEEIPIVSSNRCKWCDQVHDGSFLQKIVGIVHSILYFFAHLLGRK